MPVRQFLAQVRRQRHRCTNGDEPGRPQAPGYG
jgi:hypothetical protein